MTLKRLALIFIASTSVIGCATSTTQKAKTAPSVEIDTNGLPAQNLSNGSCGLFFWSMTTPKHFVFFQKEGADKAKLFFDGRTQDLSARQVTTGLEDNSGINLSYIGPFTEEITVKGIYGETLEGGRRISEAAILIGKDDGWQEIVPVSGLFACR